MKKNWERTKEYIPLSDDDFRAWYPRICDSRITLQLISQGLSNTNYRVLCDGQARYILRLVRNPTIFQVETQLQSMVQGYLPVPSLIDQYSDDRHWSYVMNIIEGAPMDRLELKDHEKQHIFASAGRILAKIHSFTFEQAGFFDEDLEIAQPLEITADSIEDIVASILTDTVRDRLGDMQQVIPHFVNDLSHLLEDIDTTPRLIHGDYNPPNIMVRGVEITGILDWEFALAGTPYFDLGNFLRLEQDLEVTAVQRFVAMYEQHMGEELVEHWQVVIRLFDLIALLSMLDRERMGDRQQQDILALVSRYIAEFHQFRV